MTVRPVVSADDPLALVVAGLLGEPILAWTGEAMNELRGETE